MLLGVDLVELAGFLEYRVLCIIKYQQSPHSGSYTSPTHSIVLLNLDAAHQTRTQRQRIVNNNEREESEPSARRVVLSPLLLDILVVLALDGRLVLVHCFHSPFRLLQRSVTSSKHLAVSERACIIGE